MKVDTLPTGRTYHTPVGSFPSLTTLLGKTSNQMWLEAWKARVGEEEAARVSKEATDRGTLIHEYAENYFNGNSISQLDTETPVVQQMTKNLINAVEKGVSEIWGQEQILYSNKYKYAGRTDMVGLWNGVPSIIDFKTSKKPKYNSGIIDYYIQCCGYAVAHNQMYKTAIRKIVIVITVENGAAQIFQADAGMYLSHLRNRVAAYYRMEK